MSNENLSKIELISAQLYGPNCDPQIIKFCQDVQNYYLINPDKFNELFQYLLNTKVPHFKFWLIDTLIQLIGQKYLNMNNETKNNFRQYLFNMFNINFETIFSETFVMNRYCLLFNKFIFYDFPENNNSIFNDILNNIYNTKDENQKINKLNLLLQIFVIFNEEFIQFRHTYNEIQINRSNIIKDYMRINTVPNILIVIKAILENEEYITNEKIIQKSIEIVSQLIDWIPFEFFYDVLNIILGNLIKKYKYYKQCCDILYMIVKKGMEPKIRRNIMDTIKINDLINNILTSTKKIDLNTLERISDIIDLIGNFILENFEYTKELIKTNNNNGNEEIIESFNWSCNELRYYFYFLKEIVNYNNKINYKETLVLCKSLDLIVLYFKSNDIILNKNINIMIAFKEAYGILEKTLKIPEEEYSFDEDLNELKNDDDFFTLRIEFSNIYKNTYNINILKKDMIESVLNNLIVLLKINNEQDMNKININSINKYDIEFCLYLINILQEGLRGNDFKDNENLSKIYKILFNYPFPNIKNADFILLTYYDTFNKGMEYIINEDKAIEHILKLYISEQGVFYNGKDFYKIKIVSYFDRFLSKIKMNIQKMEKINFINMANTLKEYLYKLIIAIKNSQNFQLLKDYCLLFHSYGIVISLEKKMDDKKILYEEALKLFIYIINELNTNNFQLNQAICEVILDCVIQFIQSIQIRVKNSIDDNIKNLFINFFDNFIGSYCINIIDNKNNSLLLKYINFLQRILILLGVNSLKYLEYFFLSDNCINLNVLTDCLKLEQNTMTSLKKDSKMLIKKTFNNFYQIVMKCNFPNDNISEENKILINIFLEFVKTFGVICFEIPEVFFENGGLDNISLLNLIDYVLNIGNKFFEDHQRRAGVKSMKYLCTYFNNNKNLFEKEQNFGEILNLILNDLFLFYKKNNKNNLVDMSNTVEIANCHFLLIDFGNIYYNYLSKYLSQNEIEQFVTLIKNVDYKKLKASNELLNAFDHIVNKFFT